MVSSFDSVSSRSWSPFLARTLLSLTLVSAALCTFPLVAKASTASLATSEGVTRLLYTASPGEVNVASIARTSDGHYDVVDDPNVVIAPTSPCESVTSNHVRCPPTIQAVRLALGDGDDHLTVEDSAYPEAEPPSGESRMFARGCS
jgi:hypothetical protein